MSDNDNNHYVLDHNTLPSLPGRDEKQQTTKLLEATSTTNDSSLYEADSANASRTNVGLLGTTGNMSNESYYDINDDDEAVLAKYSSLNNYTNPLTQRQEVDNENTEKTTANVNFNEQEVLDQEKIEKYGQLISSDNPLIQRVQDSLYRQLSERNRALDLQLSEKDEALRQSVKKREDVGVQLYQLQQELVRFQHILDTTEKQYHETRTQRETLEKELKQVTEAQTMKMKELKDKNLKYDYQREELEKLARALQQIQYYQLDLESQLKVAKTSTLKTEEMMRQQELEKKRQDFRIDALVEQLRSLESRKSIYEAQIKTQQQETKALLDMIQDATTETEAIQFEKKQLLQQWKSSLMTLQKKEEVYMKIEKGIELNKENNLSLEKQIGSFKISLRKVAEQRESLNAVAEKISAQISQVQSQLKDIQEQKDVVRREYSRYSQQISMNEEKLNVYNKDYQSKKHQVKSVDTQIDFTNKEIKKIEQQVIEVLNEQLFLKKGNQGTKKDANAIRAQITEKEGKLIQMENDLAQTQLESLEINDRITTLKKALVDLDQQYGQMNKQIEKYEVDIKKAGDEITKKQTEIDMLHKKYDQLANKLDESTGPLESIIKNLTREIAVKEKECQQLQTYWLRAQNELVVLMNKASDSGDEILRLQMKLTVLKRKKMVMDSQFESEEKQITQYKRSIKQLQKQIEKISGLIAGQANLQATLEEKNFGLEQEIRSKLKDGEIENMDLQRQIEDTVSEREKALQGLVEAERQIMLWEKKIQLAKETQAALDPNIGASEMTEMQAEIHRMKLKYQSILKLQEKMIVDMERAVERREIIGGRIKGKAKGSAQMVLERTITEVSKKIKQTLYDLNECERDMDNLLAAQERIEAKMSEGSEKIRSLEFREHALLEQLERMAYHKSMSTQATLLLQKLQKRCHEVKEGKYTFMFKDDDQRHQEAEKYHEKLIQVQSLVKDVERSTNGKIQDIIFPVSQFLDIHI